MEYSTATGETGMTRLVKSPFLSNRRNVSVSAFWLMPQSRRLMALKRCGLVQMNVRTGIAHLFAI